MSVSIYFFKGVNWFLRKIASKSSIQVNISQDGVIRTVIAIRTQEDKFRVNEAYSSVDINGVKIKVSVYGKQINA